MNETIVRVNIGHAGWKSVQSVCPSIHPVVFQSSSARQYITEGGCTHYYIIIWHYVLFYSE